MTVHAFLSSQSTRPLPSFATVSCSASSGPTLADPPHAARPARSSTATSVPTAATRRTMHEVSRGLAAKQLAGGLARVAVMVAPDALDERAHHVADADHAEQEPVLHHGEMADTAFAHELRRRDDVVVGRDGDRPARHDLADPDLGEAAPLACQTHKVALGEDADQLRAVANRYAAHVLLVHAGDGQRHRVVRPHADDANAHDLADPHFGILVPIATNFKPIR